MLNVFTFWRHYHAQYVKQLEDARIMDDEYNEWLFKEGQILTKPDPEEEKAPDYNEDGVPYDEL